MLKKTKNQGYTLIEVTTVMLVILILILIAIPIFLSLRDRAFDTQARANIRNGVIIAKQYFTDEETFVGMNSTNLNKYVPGAPLQDIGSDCRIDPPGSDVIHAKIYVQTGLADGSACIGVWTKGSDERYTWTVDVAGNEELMVH